jgi:hypothetical protein
MFIVLNARTSNLMMK